MNHLIVYAHPNPKSFCSAIFDHISALSEDLGNKVSKRDLYKNKFNPVLDASDFVSIQKGNIPKDILTEQKLISEADLITIIFPLWWTGYPAILKGWIDRVLLHGFAFKYSREKGVTPLLNGKKVQLITTMGASVDEYESNGLMDAMAMTMGDNVWSFCGCEDAGMIVLGDIPGMSDKDRQNILTEIEDTLILAMSSSKKPVRETSSPKAKSAAKAKKAPNKKLKSSLKKAPKKSPAKKK
jgi:NAD(P)H dehydrogenase (quinone)